MVREIGPDVCPLLGGGSGFLHKHPIYRAPPSLPSPQDVSSVPTAVLCLGLRSEAHISTPSPCLQWWACLSGWVGRAGVRTPCAGLTLSCCHTRVVMFSHTENEALLLSKLSPRWGASPDVQTAPHFHVPSSMQAPSHFLSSSFCFFFLLAYLAQQECICPCRFPRASASGQLGSVRSVPFLCILHVFVERDPLASWSFCLYFNFELVKGSSIFSKSLRKFSENSRQNYLLFDIFQLALPKTPGFDAKETKDRRFVSRSNPRNIWKISPQKL